MSPANQLPGGFVKDIVGYCDPLSVLPGEAIGFKLSAYAGLTTAQYEVVELISGDDRPHGTGFIENRIETSGHFSSSDLSGEISLEHQSLRSGSYLECKLLPEACLARVHLWFYPTLLRPEAQTLLSWGDFHITLNETGVYCRWNSDELVVHTRLNLRRWYALEFVSMPAPVLTLTCSPLGPTETIRTLVSPSASQQPGNCAGVLRIGAKGPGEGVFNGRIENPLLQTEDGVLAEWDFALGMDTQIASDVSGNQYHAELLQTPTRAICGHLWDGTAHAFHQQPTHYGAIHFHEDDLTDAGWRDTLRLVVPEDLPSGQYALKVTSGESEDYVPFFVRAPRTQRRALAYLVPTASYLAYANQRLGFSGGIFGDLKFYHANDAFLYAHEDVGYSMYEYHRDQSGVHFSARLRPILNMKPRNGTWAFNADTHVTAWLKHIQQEFDVVTDEDLHREGADVLDGYRVVITGTHPEYYSTPMWDGLQQWLNDGGRLMYMGGNGFYWRVAFQPDNPAVMEVRRAEDGTRAWIAQPGEYYHQFTGEYGGMWRRVGRPPNTLVGIGFAAQGFDGGTYYRIQPGALNPRVAFIMEGVAQKAGETWGAFGNQGGGAAGEEIDRYDETLGSPPHAIVIASSENHRPGMLRVKEEFHMMELPGDDPKVRADMTFFEVPGGGAVFSTGSISYAGSLAHNDYDNEVCLLTNNVLRRFLDAEPFALPTEAAD